MFHWQQKVFDIIQELVDKACSEYIIRRYRLTYLLAGMGLETGDFLPRVSMQCMHSDIYQYVCPSVCLSGRPSVRLSVCQSVSLSVCQSVCTSVCLSVQCWYCVKMNGHIVALCSHSLRTSFYSFQSHRRYKIPRGTLGGGVKNKGGIFCCCIYIALYVGKQYEIALQLLWNPIGSHR